MKCINPECPNRQLRDSIFCGPCQAEDDQAHNAAMAEAQAGEAEARCLYCGTPSAQPFCSDECELLAEYERPGSTDSLRSILIDAIGTAACIAFVLAL